MSHVTHTKKSCINRRQHNASHCNTHHNIVTLQHTATQYNQLQHICEGGPSTIRCNIVTVQHTATHRNKLQHSATQLQGEACNDDTLQHSHTATHCNTLQHSPLTAIHPGGEAFNNTSQHNHTATHCNTLERTATHCNTLQHTATHCDTLQHTATHCNTLQGEARNDTLQHKSHCNTLQQTATQSTHCNTPGRAGLQQYVPT